MTYKFEIRDGKLTEREKIDLASVHLEYLAKIQFERRHITTNVRDLNGDFHRHSFSVPFFEFESLDSIFEELGRLNSPVKKKNNTLPKRRFGVYSSPNYDVVFRSPAIPDLADETEIRSDAIEHINFFLDREVGQRHYDGYNLQLPVLHSLGIISVRKPVKGLLFEMQEKIAPVKSLYESKRNGIYQELQDRLRSGGIELVQNQENPYKDIYLHGKDGRVVVGGHPYFRKIKK